LTEEEQEKPMTKEDRDKMRDVFKKAIQGTQDFNKNKSSIKK
jgi:hypothetical protein